MMRSNHRICFLSYSILSVFMISRTSHTPTTLSSCQDSSSLPSYFLSQHLFFLSIPSTTPSNSFPRCSISFYYTQHMHILLFPHPLRIHDSVLLLFCSSISRRIVLPSCPILLLLPLLLTSCFLASPNLLPIYLSSSHTSSHRMVCDCDLRHSRLSYAYLSHMTAGQFASSSCLYWFHER
jgi:hypothetical protein